MKGSSTISFVLVLPWVIFSFLAIVTLAVWILSANTLHYAAFQGARQTGLYAFEKTPAVILRTNTPVDFALDGESIDLTGQMTVDRWGYPLMDNWIPFCGKEGDYARCKP